ncbi:uncharacterized protein [Drosophila pseudoobscura]|uniref:Uncharacterized protein isoform X1 n=1 Tax=Drosophila pseudoobscura pseudoobscura TaxID=46245 RepID=A0A6I8UQW1_DROPS|nr:uncharacterized protein LOC4802347 isoform X1 [Drosophila pseudoobscura]
MTNQKIPEWVNGLSLKQAIHATLGDGEKILDVTPVIDEIQYRNCTVLLPISAKVLMMDQTLRKITFMLKAQHCSKFQARIMTHLKLFAREDHMYHKVLPKLERMFQSVGKTVTFGPRAFKLDKSIKVHYILMEDLRTKGYQNVCRQEGFDLVSIKAVLKKLAEFHAASAVYVERHGMFGKLLADGVYTRNNRNILKKLNDVDPFLSQLRGSSLASRFHKRLINKERVLVDRMLEMHSRQTLTDFCVLNHCDGWVNNVMLKFDSFGKVEDTALIDYQVVRYGSPAHDLYYTILSSAQMEIKLDKFDHFVQYYYYHLVDNLKILNYRGRTPQLKNIRDGLHNNGLAAYVVATRVLPIAMMSQLEDEVNDPHSYATKLKGSMANSKYSQAMNDILPWMDDRGLLNWC